MNTGECRSCGAKIIWAKTSAGKNMPLDHEPNLRGNIVLDAEGCTGPATVAGVPVDQPRYLSHFATCPGAAHWRKK